MSKVYEHYKDKLEKNGPEHPDEMKARPIKNLLKHCQKTGKALAAEVLTGNNREWTTSTKCQWLENKGWIQAITYIIANYKCTPK